MDSQQTQQCEGSSATAGSSVVIDGATTLVERLVIDDRVVAAHLAARPTSERASEVVKAVSVGVRGISSMGAGTTISAVSEEIERIVAEARRETTVAVNELLDAGGEALAAALDPSHRDSYLARAVLELERFRVAIGAAIDPSSAGSEAARFVEALDRMLGPDGDLVKRVAHELDPANERSGLARTFHALRRDIADLRDMMSRQAGRREESARGTAKGFDYEDAIEALLRSIAGGLAGCIVERVGDEPGELGPQAFVGDFVLVLPTGQRVVVEAKNTERLGVAGPKGTLAELDRAMDNRTATFAICVSASDAFPQEVGSFAVFGNRILVVDGGTDGLLPVAIRWAQLSLQSSGQVGDRIDATAVNDRLDRIRQLATRISAGKRALTEIRNAVDGVRSNLDGLRHDLMGLVEELAQQIDPVTTTSPESRMIA